MLNKGSTKNYNNCSIFVPKESPLYITPEFVRTYYLKHIGDAINEGLNAKFIDVKDANGLLIGRITMLDMKEAEAGK